MSAQQRYPKALILIVLAMLLLGALASAVVNKANLSRSQIPIWGSVPDFEFTTQDGQPFGRRDMIGKLTVVDFIFTSCPGVCPVLASRFTELYKLYDGSDKVQLISITVDPDRDTLEALRVYATDLGVRDNRWLFLRGPIEDVVRLCEEGFMLPADGLPGGHTSKLILVDDQGRIRSYHDGMEESHLATLKNNIHQLARDLP